jgi:predicted phage terminase large subunit-like protein
MTNINTSFVPEKEMSFEERILKEPWLLDAEVCRKSFYEFVKEFWSVVCNEEPVWNWHIEYLCNELQIVAERVAKRLPKEYDLVINVPPGSSKSTICTIMFPAWSWLADPSFRILSASYSSNLSLEHADKSRDIIRSDKYGLWFPEISLRRDKDLKSNYENTKLGTRFATSVGGTATGMHGHIIIVDDPLNPKQAASDLERVSANTWLDSTLSTRKVDKAMTPTILIMQRLHVNDCTAHVLKKGTKIRHISLPGELNDEGIVIPDSLRENYKDGLLDPIRISRETLAEMRKDLGERNYLGQIQQNPILKEGAMFQKENFNLIRGFDPKEIVASIRYWDKAGTQDGGKYTGGVLMHKLRNGRFVVAHVIRGQWSAQIREKKIRMTAQLDGTKVRIITEQEPGSGGKESAENTIRMLAGYNVSADRVTGEKTVRAEPYAVQIENCNVDVVMGEWTQNFLDEHEIYPIGKFKDQVDAASGAFNNLAVGILKAGTWGRR